MVYKLLGSLAPLPVLILLVHGNLTAQAPDQLTAIFPGVDRSNVSEDVSVRIPVLRNDHSPETSIDTLSLQVAADGVPRHGTVRVDFDHGMMIYQPMANFNGLDSFIYRVCSKQGVCGRASVSVRVHPVNDGPQAHADIFTTEEEQAVLIDPLSNDSDEDQGMISTTHTLHLVTEPHHGAVFGQDWNSFLYEPDQDYFGGDFFYYAICDDVNCDTAMIRLEVTPVNDAPAVNDDTVSTFANLLAVIDVLANDHDNQDNGAIDPSTLVLDDLFIPSNGEAYLDTSSALIIYVPDPDFVGVDSFLYRVCDQGPGEPSCSEATVIIKVGNQDSGANKDPRQPSTLVGQSEMRLIGDTPSHPRSAVNRQ